MSSPVDTFASAWQMVAKRLLAHWRSLSSIVLGVLMATAIMSGAVVYFDALKELALKSTLSQYSAAQLDILVRGDRGPTSREEFEKVEAVTQSAIDDHLDWMLTDRIAAGKSPTFFLTQPGDENEAGNDNARSYFAFFPRFQEKDRYITILEGKLPSEERLSGPGELLVLEAIIPSEAAQLFQVGVGDTLSAVPHWDDVTPYVTVVISGVFTRNDPDDEMWALEREVINAATGPSFRTVPFYLSRKTYLDVLGSAFREMDSTYAWLLAVDRGRLNALNAHQALDDIRQAHSILNARLTSYVQTTALDNALVEYDRRLFFSKLPMFVVLVLIALVILYYVATLSTLVVEERRGEIALLRSRGASSAQILGVFMLEGATIAIPAFLVGPLLAAGIVGLLGYTPAFSDLSGGEWMTTRISSGAYLMSALGGFMAFVSLMIPAIQASRIGVTQHRQQSARPSSRSAFQRYYVDVLLLLVSILLFRQLTEQGSVVASNVFGQIAVNQLLLVLPGLVLIASAMVLLRLFPLTLNLIARLTSSRLPAGLVLGLWQMARNPTHYARLSLLLILAAGLGIFASSFGSTLTRSFEERVLYATGSDIRVDGLRTVGRPRGRFSREPVLDSAAPDLVQTFEQIDGIELASPALRGRGSDLSKSFGERFEMLAMDAERFNEVAYFRDDFSDEPLEDLLKSLQLANPPKGVELGDGIRSLSVRLKAERPQPTVRFSARLRDDRNHYFTVALGHLESSNWSMMRSRNTPTAVRVLLTRGPLTLVSLRVEETLFASRLQAGSILIDEIRVTTAQGELRVVERFNDSSDWSVLETTAAAVSDVLRPSGISSDGDSVAVLFSWSVGPPQTARGILHGTERPRIPVLASESFARSTGYAPGREFDISVAGFRVPVKLSETIDLFPTMTSADEKFLIADLTSIITVANLGAIIRQLRPNEVWLSTTSTSAHPETQIEEVSNAAGYTNTFIHDRSALLSETKVDPLVDAGWRALLFVAFSTVLVLSCLGFLFHAYVSFQNRRVEFALLRTVGITTRQIMAMVWLEQTLVVIAGLALGTWMGGRLGATIIPFMGHDDLGFRVVPPYIIDVGWESLVVTYVAMALVFAVISLGLIWLVRRITLQRVLRLGEM